MHKLSATLAALLLVLAACGEDGGTETTAAGTTAAPDGEPVEITLWFNGETVPPDEFASLEEEHNIRVTYDIRGDDILTFSLQMRDAGEKLPDLVEIDSHLTPAFIEAGLAQPMDEWLELWEAEDPDLYATVHPEVWETGTVDGSVMHAPVKAGYDLIYYNVAMLEEAGVEPNWETWTDVLEAARAVKEAIPGLGAYFGTGGTSHDRMFYWLTNFGVPFNDNVPDLNTPQGIAMIEWLQALGSEGLVNPGYMIGEQDESQGAFIRQDLPILQEGANGGISFMETEGYTYGPDGWMTTAMPVEGGEQMSVPRGWTLMSETEHPAEAMMALRYLMEPENAIPRFTVLLSSPIRSTAVMDSPELEERMPYFTQEIRDIFSGISRQIPLGTNTTAVGDILLDLLDELTVVTTDEPAADLAARYQAELDGLG
jgi:ABC-type glycerol-3-phosphate transport system substrate-binding protein